jgi:outer membrane lipoprotein-sorting protein
MVEPSGDYTRIDFSGEKINTSIPDEKFLVP